MKVRILYLCVALISYSCSNDNATDPTPPSQDQDFRFPTSNGMSWYYTTLNYVTNYRPDSIANIIPNDTIVGYGLASLHADTVIASDTFKVMRNSHYSEGHAHTTIELYRTTDSGMFRHAFFTSGTNFGPFRHGDLVFAKHGFETTDPFRLLKQLSGDSGADDTILTFDDPPVKVFHYPISTGTEWTHLDYEVVRITKQYSGFENVTTGSGNYYCAKIVRKWYFNNSPEHDPELNFTDYFSSSGMIRRNFIIHDILVLSQTGDTLGNIDVVESAVTNIISGN